MDNKNQQYYSFTLNRSHKFNAYKTFVKTFEIMETSKFITNIKTKKS